MMITEPVSKQFLRKASELLAGLLSIFGFYTAMFVSVYNITFNQESFGYLSSYSEIIQIGWT